MSNNITRQKLHIDECQFVILKILGQVIHDYLSLNNSSKAQEIEYYNVACKFLFDDNYMIKYGDRYKSTNDLLSIVGLDIKWLRDTVVEMKRKKIEKQRIGNHKYFSLQD